MGLQAVQDTHNVFREHPTSLSQNYGPQWVSLGGEPLFTALLHHYSLCRVSGVHETGSGFIAQYQNRLCVICSSIILGSKCIAGAVKVELFIGEGVLLRRVHLLPEAYFEILPGSCDLVACACMVRDDIGGTSQLSNARKYSIHINHVPKYSSINLSSSASIVDSNAVEGKSEESSLCDDPTISFAVSKAELVSVEEETALLKRCKPGGQVGELLELELVGFGDWAPGALVKFTIPCVKVTAKEGWFLRYASCVPEGCHGCPLFTASGALFAINVQSRSDDVPDTAILARKLLVKSTHHPAVQGGDPEENTQAFNQYNQLISYIESGDTVALHGIMREGGAMYASHVLADYYTPSGLGLIHIATVTGRLKVVQTVALLLGDDLWSVPHNSSRSCLLQKTPNEAGDMCAHVAAYHGHIGILNWLHNVGIDLTSLNNVGEAPAHRAVLRQHGHVLLWLTRVPKVDIFIPSSKGLTVLDYAKSVGAHYTLLELLTTLRDQPDVPIRHPATAPFEDQKIINKLSKIDASSGAEDAEFGSPRTGLGALQLQLEVMQCVNGTLTTGELFTHLQATYGLTLGSVWKKVLAAVPKSNSALALELEVLRGEDIARRRKNRALRRENSRAALGSPRNLPPVPPKSEELLPEYRLKGRGRNTVVRKKTIKGDLSVPVGVPAAMKAFRLGLMPATDLVSKHLRPAYGSHLSTIYSAALRGLPEEQARDLEKAFRDEAFEWDGQHLQGDLATADPVSPRVASRKHNQRKSIGNIITGKAEEVFNFYAAAQPIKWAHGTHKLAQTPATEGGVRMRKSAKRAKDREKEEKKVAPKIELPKDGLHSGDEGEESVVESEKDNGVSLPPLKSPVQVKDTPPVVPAVTSTSRTKIPPEAVAGGLGPAGRAALGKFSEGDISASEILIVLIEEAGGSEEFLKNDKEQGKKPETNECHQQALTAVTLVLPKILKTLPEDKAKELQDTAKKAGIEPKRPNADPTKHAKLSEQELAEAAAEDAKWSMTDEERTTYEAIFCSRIDDDSDEYLSGDKVVSMLSKSGLDKEQLAQAWKLVDKEKRGNLDIHEWSSLMHIVVCVSKRNFTLPSALPICLGGEPPESDSHHDDIDESRAMKPTHKKKKHHEKKSKQAGGAEKEHPAKVNFTVEEGTKRGDGSPKKSKKHSR